ncbi:MBL fold metallo-hydrolase [Pseudomaricurvus sp.]|uniref:MBL fold metallo-hydrolase n=1 Tax=Pseudomaricurvus sp. TaxID=2004510 RepID=UPI003F6D0B0E
MKFQVIPVTPYQQNCTLMWCEETKKAAVVDPGGDLDRIEQAVAQHGLELEKILVTHAHLDHVGGVATLAKKLSLPIEGPHKEDKFWIDMLPEQSQMMGFPPAEVFEPNRWLEGGDEIRVGNETIEVRFCPGHTPGHVILFHRPSQLAIVGDVLFQGSIGRTDFPRGDYDTLIESIRTQLWPLGDGVQFIPGHGPMSTFGHERQTNPFVADKNLKQ